jgi:transporter family-2 protein
VLFWGAVTFLAGAALAAQARMNGELATRWGHGLDAAIWSFGSGLMALTLVMAFSPRMRQGFGSLRKSLRRGEIRWWQCIGGVVGGFFVFSQAYAVPIAGVALFTIAVVGAQTLTAVGVDKLGIGPAGRVPVSVARVVAALLAIVGVVVAVGGRVSGTTAAVVVPAILAAVVGAAATVQQGINGRVTVAARSPMTTTWLNFATGTATLLVLAGPGLRFGSFGRPESFAAPWWAWLGGLVGTVIIGVTAVAVRPLGVLLVMLLMLAGQLVAAVGLDALDPETRGHITPPVVVGLLVTLGAAALAGVAGARSARRTRAAQEQPHEVLPTTSAASRRSVAGTPRSAPIPRGDAE